MEVVILTQQDKRKLYNANYLNTENGRLKRAENIKRFYENHPDKKEHHYEIYHDTFARCSKEYYLQHRDKILAQKREKYHAQKKRLKEIPEI